jgi:hypothetical protein
MEFSKKDENVADKFNSKQRELLLGAMTSVLSRGHWVLWGPCLIHFSDGE